MMSMFGMNGLIETGAGLAAAARGTEDDVPAAFEGDHTARADATTITTNRNASDLNPLLSPTGRGLDHHRLIVLLGHRDPRRIKYSAPVENGARLDRGVGRPLVDPNRPHGAVTVGGGAPSLALVRMPTLRPCPAGLEATGNAAGERRVPPPSGGTGAGRGGEGPPPATNTRAGAGAAEGPGAPAAGVRNPPA